MSFKVFAWVLLAAVFIMSSQHLGPIGGILCGFIGGWILGGVAFDASKYQKLTANNH